jgi:O-antigen/teichoic acid export membrane protein
MALEIAGILAGLRITQAMFRFYILEEDQNKKKSIVSTVFITALVMSTVAVSGMLLMSPHISRLLFGGEDFLFEFRLFCLTLVPMALTATGMVFIQAKQRPVLYLLFSVFSLVLQVSGNIYFVVYLELHVLGVVYSALLSGGVVAFVLSVYLIWNVGIKFDKEIYRRLIKFVYPLILASLAGFYVAYSDKYYLRLFEGLSVVGLYVLAGRLASVAEAVYSAFNQSWSAARFEIYKQDNNKVLFNRIFKLLSVGLIMIGSGLILFSKDLIFYMADEKYHPAIYFVPGYVIAVIIRLYVPFFNFGLMLKEETKYLAFASWIKAALSTILYLSLIPLIGAYGALLGLLLSNMFEAVYIYYHSKKMFDMEIKFMPVLILLLFAFLLVPLGWILPAGSIDSFLSRVGIYAILVLLAYYLPIWSAEEKDSARNMVNSLSAIIKGKVSKS